MSGITPVFADFYDFEDLPNANISAPQGGGVDIGSFYNDINFGAGVQGVQSTTLAVTPLGNPYPTHSGTQEIWQSNIGSGNPTIAFNNAFLASEVSFWYSTAFGMQVYAYDAGGNLVASANLPVNSDPFGSGNGTTSFVDLNVSTPSIDHVFIFDNAGGGNFSTIDDLSVPDATSTLALLGVSGMAMLAFRRKIVTQ